MILRDRLEKLPNNSILIISANKKIYRDEIINHYNKNINKLAGARVLICHSDESVVLPIITALDGIVEVFALISPTIPSELISLLAIKGNFEVILCNDSKTFNQSNQIDIYNLEGKSNALGVQAQIDAEILPLLDLRLAYRFYDVKTTYKNRGVLDKPYLAKHRAFINVGYEIKDKWMFDATVNWFSEQRLPSTSINSSENRRSTSSPSYFILSGQVTKQWKKLAVYAGVENALNFRQSNPIIESQNPFSNEFDASMIWGPVFGRNIYVGLRYII